MPINYFSLIYSWNPGQILERCPFAYIPVTKQYHNSYHSNLAPKWQTWVTIWLGSYDAFHKEQKVNGPVVFLLLVSLEEINISYCHCIKYLQHIQFHLVLFYPTELFFKLSWSFEYIFCIGISFFLCNWRILGLNNLHSIC